MKDYRKLILGLAYITACAFLGFWHIQKSPAFDGLGLAAIFAGLATGVAAIVYGNVKEHEHAASVSISDQERKSP